MSDEEKKEEVKDDKEFTPEDFKPPEGKIGNEGIERQESGEPTVEEDEAFNLDDVDENAPDFPPIPIGWYDCTITNTRYNPSKAGDPMMNIEFTVTDEKYPAYKGRRVTERCLFKYNGSDSDPIAEMGRKRFKKTMVRAGVAIDWATFKPATFAKSGEALGKKLRVKFGVGDPYENNEGQMTRSNSVKDCKSMGSGDAFLADSP